MLSNKTQDCLCDLLIEIAKGEKNVEAIRQLLGEQPHFESYSAFRRIDQNKKRFIVSSDVHEFLLLNGFPRSQAECETFIESYDLDSDNKMSYTEFLRAVLSYDDQGLREIVSQRPPIEIRQGEKLSSEVEYTLSKLIDKEIENVHNVNEKKAALMTRFDFDCADCFDAIDFNRKRYLDGRDFYEYFRKNSLVSYENEIKALARRIDFDQDGRISFQDFSRLFSNPSQSQLPLHRERSSSFLRITNIANDQFNQRQTLLVMSPTHQPTSTHMRNQQIQRQPLYDSHNDNYISNTSEITTLETTTISRRRGSNLNMKTPQSQQQHFNSTIDRPVTYAVASTNSIDASRQSPVGKSSTFGSSNTFKNSPAGKSILKNSSKKLPSFEQEKDNIRYELHESKKKEQQQQQQHHPKVVNFNESNNSRIQIQSNEIKQQSQAHVDESISKKEHEKLLARMRDLRKQETQQLLDRQIEQKKEQIEEGNTRQKQQLSDAQRANQRTPIQERKPFQSKVFQKEIPRKTSFDSSKQLPRKSSITGLDSAKNAGTPLLSRIPEPPQAQNQSSQVENRNELTRAEQRLLELAEQKRIQQLENQRFKQESEAKERRIQQEETSIRQQIEYELYLKQRVQQLKRSYSIDNTTPSAASTIPNRNYFEPVMATTATSTPNQRYLSPSKSMQRVGGTPNKQVDAEDAVPAASSKVNYHSTPSYQSNKTTGTMKPAQSSPSSYTSPIDLEYTLKRNKSKEPHLNGGGCSSISCATTNDETLKRNTRDANNRLQHSDVSQQTLGEFVNEVVRQFQELIAAEKKSERALQDLSLRPDFKLGDLFKILDRSQRGIVTRNHLEDFFRRIDLNLNTADLFLYMRRYDHDNDGKLSFANVAESLTPRQKEYAKLLNKRESYLQGEIVIEEIYSFETLRLLKETFKTLINAERIIEGIRADWKQQRQSGTFEYVFSHIDADQDGFLSPKDIFFEKNSVFCSEKEVLLLVAKFDRDADGSISFGEFVQELAPKLPLY